MNKKNRNVATIYRNVCRLLELTVRSKMSPQYFSDIVS